MYAGLAHDLMPATAASNGKPPRDAAAPSQQRRIDPVPEFVGAPLVDTLIGATGEHLAQRRGLRIPDWTQRPEHFALEKPQFIPDSRALRGVLIVESPPAFRSRLIFTGAEPLDRARFPKDIPRAKVPLAWPPPPDDDDPDATSAPPG
jgi:hypothetical protein